MLSEAVGHLNLMPGYTALDGTAGCGGHASLILDRIQPGGRLIGIDADASAVDIARDAVKSFGDSCKIVNDNFRNLDTVLEAEGIQGLDACLLDLGVSSIQIDDGARGFSLQHDARLDMRMDPRSALSAWDVINRYRESDLFEIIRDYGEERYARRVARYIVQSREESPIDTTAQLRQLCHRAVKGKWGRIDPATRTFQAIRIEVNDELGALEEGLKKAVDRLNPGRRIAVISFHSLEDRIVKNTFRSYAASGQLKIITKKPLTASHEETVRNPRSRSAKLRVAERIANR